MISSACLALIVIPAIYALTKGFLNRAIRSLIENAGFSSIDTKPAICPAQSR